MERVDVPGAGIVFPVHDVAAELVGGADHRPAGLAGMEERLAIHLARHRVVDDVAGLEALVVGAQPGVDPEALDADDLLLLVAHRAGDVHHVDHYRIGLRQLGEPPAPVPLVLAGRNDDRDQRVVRPGRDAPLQRLLVGALEVSKRFGAGRVHARVLHLGRGEVLLALALDARERQLLAQDVGELVEREIDFQRVLSFALPRLALAVAFHGSGSEHGAGLAVALADAALVLVAVSEVRDVDGRDGDGDQVLPLLPDHLPLLDVLAKVLLDPPADDLAKPAVVLFDLQRHPGPPQVSVAPKCGRSKLLYRALRSSSRDGKPAPVLHALKTHAHDRPLAGTDARREHPPMKFSVPRPTEGASTLDGEAGRPNQGPSTASEAGVVNGGAGRGRRSAAARADSVMSWVSAMRCNRSRRAANQAPADFRIRKGARRKLTRPANSTASSEDNSFP